MLRELFWVGVGVVSESLASTVERCMAEKHDMHVRALPHPDKDVVHIVPRNAGQCPTVPKVRNSQNQGIALSFRSRFSGRRVHMYTCACVLCTSIRFKHTFRIYHLVYMFTIHLVYFEIT